MLLNKLLCVGIVFVISNLVAGNNIDMFIWLGNGFRMKNFDVAYLVRSLNHCATMCSSSSTCIGLNFNTESLRCELVVLRPRYVIVSARNNVYERADITWKLYERGDCQLGEKTGTYCHHMVTTDATSWQEARQVCLDMGLDLAIVRNSTEMEHLNEDLVLFHPFTSGSVWLGASSTDGTISSLKWVDNTALSYTYYVNTLASINTNRCLEAYQETTTTWRWMYSVCAISITPVCERR